MAESLNAAPGTAWSDVQADGARSKAAGQPAKAPAEPASDTGLIDQRSPSRRRPDRLAIGAPLTAAFIGGALVFEGLANARQRGEAESSDPSISETSSRSALEDEGPGHQAWSAASGHGRSVDGLAEAARADQADLTAAPAADRPASPGRAAADDGAAAVQETGEVSVDGAYGTTADAGGAPLSLSVVNVSLGDGSDPGAEVDPFVEDEPISRNTIVGTPGDDVLIGTDGDDAISGGSGNDVLFGKAGNDVLNGNDGDDQLFGGTGRDRLDGGAGNDLLDGGIDTDLDILKGGSGNDVLIINGLHDVALERLAGPDGGGIDHLIVRSGYADQLPAGVAASTFVFYDNFGEDLPAGAAAYRQQLSKGIENVTLEGSAKLDIFADGGANRLTGNDGDNLIHGGGGDDILLGGAGDDVLRGGAGNDRLTGGPGRDELYGDAGNDTFVIGLNDSAIDTIFDHSGANRVVLEGVTTQTVNASLFGDDLYITVDRAPVAMVSGYAGHENSLAGIDFGHGLKTIDSLLVDHPDLAAAIGAAEARAALDAADDFLSAHLHLSEPTILGTRGADRPLIGTDGDDWLSGFDGQDHLYGGTGNDVLEGGGGADLLVGGAGNDRYLFRAGEDGIDTIRDTEGHNVAELKGFEGAKIEASMLGDDLAVLANGRIVFTVDDFAGHEAAFAGVQAGNKFIATEDLLA